MAAWIALVGFVVFAVLAFGLRSVVQLRRTGSTGFVGFSGRPGSLEHTGGVLFAIAMGLGLVAPITQIAGASSPLAALDNQAAAIAGGVLFAAGLAGTLGAQMAMGDAWRIGVDPGAQTTLVIGGPFAWVRNPIFSAMFAAALGLLLLAPNAVACASFGALFVAIEIQVRAVEEPYLSRMHGETYRAYAGRVGRFLPFVGCLR